MIRFLLMRLQPSDWLPVRWRWRLLRAAGATVSGPAIVRAGTRIEFPEGLQIGAGAYIQANCFFDARAGIDIGDGAGIGDGVRMTTATHEIGPSERRIGRTITHPIRIGRGAWLGSGCIVMAGADVGDGTIVGAGSVVKGKLEPNAIYAGVPAKLRRSLDPA